MARAILGAWLVRDGPDGRCAGRIVETEAYPGPHDPASHAAESIGRTRRNDPMFGPPATAYVHLNYGIHWCLNVVVGPPDFPAAVLLRALDPVEGLEAMRERRGRQDPRDLCSGPAKLTQALAIGPEFQRHPLTEPPLFLAEGEEVPDDRVVRTTRVGVSRGAELPLRFYDRTSDSVSRKRTRRSSP